MTAKTERAELRAAQLAATVDALTDAALNGKPGLTVYALSIHIPVLQPRGLDPQRPGLLATSAPLTLVLKLLADLETAGTVRQQPDPDGARWHLTGPPVKVLPCARIHGGAVVLVAGEPVTGPEAGWLVKYLGEDGAVCHVVFINRVIADQAAEAIRGGTYDRETFNGRDLTVAEGVTA